MITDNVPVRPLASTAGGGGDTGQGLDGTQESEQWVHSQYGLGKMVRPAGFEPASTAWKAAILNQARLWPRNPRQVTPYERSETPSGVDLPDRSVEGLHHCLFGEQMQTLKLDDLRSGFKSIDEWNHKTGQWKGTILVRSGPAARP
jgi:hypothetical protein